MARVGFRLFSIRLSLSTRERLRLATISSGSEINPAPRPAAPTAGFEAEGITARLDPVRGRGGGCAGVRPGSGWRWRGRSAPRWPSYRGARPGSIASTSRHPGGSLARRGGGRRASRPLLRPPPDLGIRISHAGLRVFIPLQLDLELERLPDVFGRALVGVLDGLGVLVPVDRAGAALMNGDLARLVVVGEGPVLAGDELKPATLRGRLHLLVGGTGEVPRADEPLGERRRARIRLGLSAFGPQAGNQGDRNHEGERGG